MKIKQRLDFKKANSSLGILVAINKTDGVKHTVEVDMAGIEMDGIGHLKITKGFSNFKTEGQDVIGGQTVCFCMGEGNEKMLEDSTPRFVKKILNRGHLPISTKGIDGIPTYDF